ncbi:MAG: DUF3147 family protein [Cellvibrionaceae bacterium]
MDTTFLFKLSLSFIVGGSFIVACSMASERLGSTLGGIIGGLPSSIVIVLFFIAWTGTPLDAVQATNIFPFALGLTGPFLTVYAFLCHRGLWIALGSAIVTWFAFSFIIWQLQIDSFFISSCCLLVLATLSYGLQKQMDLPVDQTVIRPKLTKRQIIYRGLFAGSIISLSVLLSKISGPLLGGIMAGFPATFIATLVVIHLSLGHRFARSLIRPLLLSATITIMVYIIAVRYTYPLLGLIEGTLISFCISSITAYILYRILKRPRSDIDTTG